MVSARVGVNANLRLILAHAIAAIVRAVAPKPVNVLLMKATPPIAELAASGVRRVSTGGALANAAWKAFDEAAAALAAQRP